MMPTFPSFHFNEIIVTKYQLRLTDAHQGVVPQWEIEGTWPQNSPLKFLSGLPPPPGMVVPPGTHVCEGGQIRIINPRLKECVLSENTS